MVRNMSSWMRIHGTPSPLVKHVYDGNSRMDMQREAIARLECLDRSPSSKGGLRDVVLVQVPTIVETMRSRKAAFRVILSACRRLFSTTNVLNGGERVKNELWSCLRALFDQDSCKPIVCDREVVLAPSGLKVQDGLFWKGFTPSEKSQILFSCMPV